MRIRPARPEELASLQEIEVAAGALFGDTDMPQIADDPPPSLEELRSAAALLVAVGDADEPIGYARIEGSTGTRTWSSCRCGRRTEVGASGLRCSTPWPTGPVLVATSR